MHSKSANRRAEPHAPLLIISRCTPSAANQSGSVTNRREYDSRGDQTVRAYCTLDFGGGIKTRVATLLGNLLGNLGKPLPLFLVVYLFLSYFLL